LIIARALGDDDCAVALLNACRDGVERELTQLAQLGARFPSGFVAVALADQGVE
jgi:hypothetical protein